MSEAEKKKAKQEIQERAMTYRERDVAMAKRALETLTDSRGDPYTLARLDTLKRIVGPTLDYMDVCAFIDFCKGKNLDPRTGGAFAMRIKSSEGSEGRLVFGIGFHGMRSLAHNSPKFISEDIPVLYDGEMKEHEIWPPNKKKPPYAGRVCVWVKDDTVEGGKRHSCLVGLFHEQYPYEAVMLDPDATDAEKQAVKKNLWRKHSPYAEFSPVSAFIKTLTMQLLRKEFPKEVGGLYSKEEITIQVSSEPQQPQGAGFEKAVPADVEEELIEAEVEEAEPAEPKYWWQALPADDAAAVLQIDIAPFEEAKARQTFFAKVEDKYGKFSREDLKVALTALFAKFYQIPEDQVELGDKDLTSAEACEKYETFWRVLTYLANQGKKIEPPATKKKPKPKPELVWPDEPTDDDIKKFITDEVMTLPDAHKIYIKPKGEENGPLFQKLAVARDSKNVFGPGRLKLVLSYLKEAKKQTSTLEIPEQLTKWLEKK